MSIAIPPGYRPVRPDSQPTRPDGVPRRPASLATPPPAAGSGIPEGFRLVRPNLQPAAQPAPTGRTFGEKVKDVGIELAQATLNEGAAFAQVPNLVTGGALDRFVVKPAQRAVDRALGGRGDAPGLAGGIAAINQGLEAGKSAALRADYEELDQADGFLEAAGTVLRKPRLMGSFLTQQIPILATLGFGAAGTAARATAREAARGAADDVAAAAGRTAAERSLVGANAAMSGGFSAQEAMQAALETPDEVWDRNPEFVALAGQVGRDEAKQQLALRAGQYAGAVAAPLGAAGAKITAPFEAGVFTRSLQAGGVRGLATAVGKEAAEELVQEGGEQFGANVGLRGAVDAQQDLFEGVPEAMGIGSTVGGVLGGGMYAGGRLATRRRESRARGAVEAAAQRAGEAAREAGVVPPEGPGPAAPQAPQADPAAVGAARSDFTRRMTAIEQAQGRATNSRVRARVAAEVAKDFPGVTPADILADAPQPPQPGAAAVQAPFPTAQPGTLADAANALPAAQPAAPAPAQPVGDTAAEQEAAVREWQSEPIADAGRVEALSPWIDPETGVARSPSDDEIRAQLHRMFDAKRAGLDERVPRTAQLARDWGVNSGRLRDLRAQVVAERKRPPESAPQPETPTAPPQGGGRAAVAAQEDRREDAAPGPEAGQPGLALGGDAGGRERAQGPDGPDAGAEAALAGDRAEPATTPGPAAAAGAAALPAPAGAAAPAAPVAAGDGAGSGGGGAGAAAAAATVDAPIDTAPAASLDQPAGRPVADDVPAAPAPAAAGAPAPAGGTAPPAGPVGPDPRAVAAGMRQQAQQQAATTPPSRIEAAAAEAAPSLANDRPPPTPKQAEAGNFKMGHGRVHGLEVTVQWPAGSRRRPRHRKLAHHYGHIRRTEGSDGDQLDVYLGPGAEDETLPVFVVDQTKADGAFDEHKVMLGFASEADARKGYLDNYPKGWNRLAGIRRMTPDEFKAWARDAEATKRPAAGGDPAMQTSGEAFDATRARAAEAYARGAAAISALETPPAEPETTTTEETTYEGQDQQQEGVRAEGTQQQQGTEADEGAAGVPAGEEGGAGAVADAPGAAQPDAPASPAEDVAAVEVAAHQDPGAPAEAGTAAVVQEAIQKSADRTPLNLAEARARLLAEVDAAIAAAPAREIPAQGKQADQAYQDAVAPLLAEIGYVTFNVPGDGRFTVLNTKARLQAFRDRVEKSPGFKKQKERTPKADRTGLDSLPAIKPADEARAQKAYGGYRDSALLELEAVQRENMAGTLRQRANEMAGSAAEWESVQIDVKHFGDALELIQRELVRRGLRTRTDLDAMNADPEVSDVEPQAPAPATPEPVQVDSEQQAAPRPAAGKIEDLGEKIGGARKDLAQPTGPRGARAKPEREDAVPAWKRRFITMRHLKTGRWGVHFSKAGRWGNQAAMRADFATEAEAEAAIPLAAVAEKHRVTERTPGNYAIARDVTDRKRVYLKDGFASRDEAMRYMAENAVELIETKTTVGEESLPRPSTVFRVGEARREGDVIDQQFIDVFGFRGVEFGNWNSQAERQEVMNHAFDGLLDLAEVVGVPPRALSLNGEMALAFGARGHGLSGARAHYERDYAVINLTKMAGAGSLAHEWMHAIDHYLARQDGKAGSKWTVNKAGDKVLPTGRSIEDDMLSGGDWGSRSGVRADVREAMRTLVRTMQRRAEDYVADTKRAEAFLGKARDDVDRRLKDLRDHIAKERRYGSRKRAATTEELAKWDALADQVLNGDLPIEWRTRFDKRKVIDRYTNDVLEQMNDVLKAVTNRGGFNAERRGEMDRLAADIKNWHLRLETWKSADSGESQTRQVPTAFLTEARKLDQGRVSNYWTLPHEMLARAFSAYVEDKIKERGGASAFLSFGSDERFALPVGDEWGRPFPGGAEREALNKAFDAFFRTIEVKEGPDGKVALFRLAPTTDPRKVTATGPEAERKHTQVAAAVTAAVADWNPDRMPRVNVVRSPSDLPPRATADPRHTRARGLQIGNEVWLVTDNMPDEDTVSQALRDLAHEATGHYGVDRIIEEFFPGGWTKLQADILAMRGNPNLRPDMQAVLREVQGRYQGADGAVDDGEFAREVVAVMAERGLRNGIAGRIVAAVRAFVRQFLPSLKITDSEIRALLSASETWLRTPEQRASRAPAPRQEQQPADSVSFSVPAAPFAQQVRERLASGDRRGPALHMGRTPPVLRMLGFPSLPLRMPAGVLFKLATGKDGARAPLSERQIAQLPELLDEAVAVFTDRQGAGVLALTSLVDSEGKPVIIAARPDVASDEVQVNLVPTAFGKDGAERWIREQVAASRLLYRGEKQNPRIPVEALSERQVRPEGEGSAAKVLGIEDLRNYQAEQRRANLAADPDGAAFDLAQETAPAGEGGNFDALATAVRSALSAWGPNAPRIQVVRAPVDLPADVRRDPRHARARGVKMPDGRVYLVASNMPADRTEALRQARRTLAHEAIGHHGVDNVIDQFMPGGWERLTADIARLRANPGQAAASIRPLLAEVEERYSRPGQPASDREFARELVAVMAERGMRNGLVGRVVAAARAFLRRIMPGLQISDAEIRGLLARAETWLRQTPAEVTADARALVQAWSLDAAPAIETPAFARWFRQSKAARRGRPIPVYHGTASEFDRFDPALLGRSTGHMTTPLGFFFAEDRRKAERYAEKAAEGMPMYERVLSGYVSVQNPATMTLDAFMEIDSRDEARALRQRLERAGHDGIHLAEIGQWIVFRPSQFKSTSNRGEFDPADDRFDFDLAEAGGKGAAQSIDRLTEVLGAGDTGAWNKAKAWAAGKWEDAKAPLLGALQLRHLIELATDGKNPLLPLLKPWANTVQQMATDRQGYMDEVGLMADQWREWAHGPGFLSSFRKPRAQAQALHDLMHEATQLGVDPAEPYQPLTIVDKAGRTMDLTRANVRERVSALNAQIRSRPGDDTRHLRDEIKYVRGLMARERARKAAYPRLQARFQALAEGEKDMHLVVGRDGRVLSIHAKADAAQKAQAEHDGSTVAAAPAPHAVWRGVRDHYTRHQERTEAALLDRIKDLVLPADAKAGLRERIRYQFERNRVDGVYFPLSRTGDYWLHADVPAGEGKTESVFAMFEGASELRAAEKALRARGAKDIRVGRRDGAGQARDAVPGTFAADVVKLLKDGGAPEGVQDQVWQLFMRSLPEMSMRKHQIHRKNVPGFDPDALRAFAKNGFHGSHQLARLRWSHVLQNDLEAQEKQIDARRRDGSLDTAESVAADRILNEVKRRHDFIMSPKDAAWANRLTGFGFAWYLGATPAAAMVNLTQGAQVTFPVLGAKYGWGRAGRALASATAASAKTLGNIERTALSDEERLAYRAMQEAGWIEKTQMHSLAGLAEGDQLQQSPAWQRSMQIIGAMFQRMEVVNREAAGMAAYRLARAGAPGVPAMDHTRAVQYAGEIINGTHFDYCVDTATECLTTTGWKRHDALRVGDIAIAIDKSGRAVESLVTAINVFPGERQALMFDGSPRRFSMVVTPHHSCVVQHYDSKPTSRRWSPPRTVLASDLARSQHLLRAPLHPIDRAGGDRDFAALLGWVAAEGWYSSFRNCKSKNCVWLSQSASHNPDYVDEIRALLQRLGGQAREYAPNKNGVISWTLNGELRKRVLAAMPDKRLTWDMVASMSVPEMLAVMDAFAKGDGTRVAGGSWSIGQKNNGNIQNLDVIQAMSLACGLPATMGKDDGTRQTLHLHRASVRGGRRTLVKQLAKSEITVDTVWCPTTEHGTWVARRGGAAFVTGNSNFNRPRWMQSNIAKVLLQFRNYSVGMTWLFWRGVHQAIRGETPEVRRLARRQTAGILGMTSILAGAMGLPIINLVKWTAMAAQAAFGDDEEPWDFGTEFYAWLSDLIGATPARYMLKGPLSMATGADIASRVGLADLWWREPDRDMEGQELYAYMLEQVAGPMGGITKGMLTGMQRLREGDPRRAVELMLPKAVKDALKAMRYRDEGATTWRGDPIMEDVSAPMQFAQAIGFTPTRLAEQYRENRALKNYEGWILDRRASLMNAFAKALADQDEPTRQRVMERIGRFNAAYPELAIGAATLRRSLQARARFSAQAEAGVVLNRRIADRLRERVGVE